jgi:cell fate (sporulation/competence/biofilm development) regulator YlbF (YheA/YmcA/DUF963 family)
MATTPEILDAADKLGRLISTHPAAKRMDDLMKRLQGDREAQRVLGDFNRHMQMLGQKEQTGRPIEIDDKRKMDTLQAAVAQNLTLRELQMAQMDYLDLMRQVDDRVSGGEGEAAAPASPIVTA